MSVTLSPTWNLGAEAFVAAPPVTAVYSLSFTLFLSSIMISSFCLFRSYSFFNRHNLTKFVFYISLYEVALIMAIIPPPQKHRITESDECINTHPAKYPHKPYIAINASIKGNTILKYHFSAGFILIPFPLLTSSI